MGREFELKLRATPAKLAAILADFEGFQEVTMETTYYDTPDQALSPLHWTLRRRLENGTSVCTLKTPCADGGRNEWQAECADITAGVEALCKAGAPEELKDLTAKGLEAVCSARFIRQALTLTLEDCTVELALDRGILRGGYRMELLAEVEVELKAGSEAAAIDFARTLAVKYGLMRERASKHQRALALAGKI